MDNREQEPSSPDRGRRRYQESGTGLAIGIGLGVALGAALHNLAVGIAIGAGVGVVLGEWMARRNRPEQ